jgi:hypothetical protein
VGIKQSTFVEMHELARHTIHSTEVLAIAIETITSMIEEHEIFFEEDASLPKATIAASKQTSKMLRFQKSIFNCLHLRSKALEERLSNEINLVALAVTSCPVLC